MARLLGSLLILAGCAGGFLRWQEGERRKQVMMEEWIRLFVRWDYALRSEHVRLYSFFGQYETGQPEIREFLEAVCQSLQQNCHPSGQEVWQSVLNERQKKLMLGGEAYEIVRQAGNAFFCGSSSESLHTVRICRERMELALSGARGDLAKRRQVYLPMGMLGGVVLIILLL